MKNRFIYSLVLVSLTIAIAACSSPGGNPENTEKVEESEQRDGAREAGYQEREEENDDDDAAKSKENRSEPSGKKEKEDDDD